MRATLMTLLVLAGSPAFLRGEDKLNDDMKARIATYVESGKKGVCYSENHDVKDGEFVRVFIVGRSVIPTSLGVEEGIEIAQECAEEAAKAAFVTWLKGKVTVKKTTTDQTIITKEGEEGFKEGDNVREQAKKVEKRAKEFKETASSLVRGLKLVGMQQNANEKTYTVVYRWDARSISAVGKIDYKLNNPIDPAKFDEPNTNAPNGRTAPNKIIPNKRIIIVD